VGGKKATLAHNTNKIVLSTWLGLANPSLFSWSLLIDELHGVVYTEYNRSSIFALIYYNNAFDWCRACIDTHKLSISAIISSNSALYLAKGAMYARY
jgi:hypothetical protein